MKNFYDKIPDISKIDKQLSKKYGSGLSKLYITLTIFVIGIVAGLAPLVLKSSYYPALFGYFITTILIIFLLLVAAKATKAVIGRWVLWILGGVQALIFLGMLFPITQPFNTHAQMNQTPKQDTLYVTYSPTCPYCQKSHANMLRAVNIFNRTHNVKMAVVNIDANTKLSRGLSGIVSGKGSIVYVGKNKTSKPVIYNLGKKINGEVKPITPSASYIYSILNHSIEETK